MSGTVSRIEALSSERARIRSSQHADAILLLMQDEHSTHMPTIRSEISTDDSILHGNSVDNIPHICPGDELKAMSGVSVARIARFRVHGPLAGWRAASWPSAAAASSRSRRSFPLQGGSPSR